jgi:hypothetical protein
LVDPKRKQVSVTPRGGRTALYGMGDRIALMLFGGELAVEEIFKTE